MPDDIVIVGAGPSGLSAGLEAAENGASVTVLERFDRVGGLCRTLDFEGCRFDIGPHRFFTRNAEVNALFERMLGANAIRVKRQTRILHGGVYFDYPLTPLNAMRGMGVRQAARIIGSYAVARARRLAAPRAARNFEEWIVDHFGRQLHELFFKTYTEKVWGIDCREIGADWAAQRIRGLSLPAALKNLLRKEDAPKTLVGEFSYPRRGAGQFYEAISERIGTLGGRILTMAAVKCIRRENMRIRSVVVEDAEGRLQEVEGRAFLTSSTLTDTMGMLDPPPPPNVLAASQALRYRDHIAVNLVAMEAAFPDNWIYVHDSSVALARISNYRNFSTAMSGSANLNPLTVEYFATPGDPIWSTENAGLVNRALVELQRLGISERDQVLSAFVVRSAKAYPVIEIGHESRVATIREWFGKLENILPIGRSGMFKYNNQDHAIATGLLAARNMLGFGAYDPWLVNIDGEYHESGEPGGRDR
jgi:protoporphyrinogen oxidase